VVASPKQIILVSIRLARRTIIPGKRREREEPLGQGGVVIPGDRLDALARETAGIACGEADDSSAWYEAAKMAQRADVVDCGDR